MKIIDLSQTLHSYMPVYPGSDSVVFSDMEMYQDLGVYMLEYKLNGHIGTHLDTPSHLYKNRKNTANLEIEQFYGKGLVVDCSSIEKGEQIPENVLDHYKNLTEIDFIFFYTGWGAKWEDEEYYSDFPVPSLSLIKRIASLEIKGIGIDALSIDEVDSASLQNHKIFLVADRIIIENLTNLDKLINKSFYFSCFPLKIENGDGSPIRAVAILD